MRIKALLITLCSILFLSGCNKEITESSSSSTPEELGYITADVIDVNTTGGKYYAEFLKLGSTATEDISVMNSSWEYALDETRETWEYDNGASDMFTYWRDTESNVSSYTRTFQVRTKDIKSWINVELVGFDNLFNTLHHRNEMKGATWYYEWSTDLEQVKLQVYSTGETGNYTALVSFIRSGPTAVSQLQGGTEE